MYASNIHTCLSKIRHTCYQQSTNKHVCKYECMHVCMYVCLKTPSLWIEIQTYMLKDTLSIFFGNSTKNDLRGAPKHVCAFQKPSACHGKWKLNAQTYTLKFGPKSYFGRLLNIHVCLKSLCLSWKMKHTYMPSNSHVWITWSVEHVCTFENPLPVKEKAIPT